MNLKKHLAAVLSFACLAARRKPAVAAVVVPATQTQVACSAPAVNTRVPAAKNLAPVTPVVAAADDDEAEMRGASAEAKARERERARCAAILASGGAARNPVLARSLAFTTNMTRREAIRTLEAMPEPATPARTSRASRNPNHGGGDPHVHPAQARAAGWARAMQQACAR
ncbi:hypothetical protein PQR14_27580 [Paraburkholderia bryophila]|uniref:hypothetical protein n=1 Tax=Paraburkholderia bryophila TaxID=420952 RepID=UPI0038BD62F4